MIAKIIKSGASFGRTANYLLSEKKCSEDGTLKPEILAIDGVSAFSADEMAADFQRQSLLNERVKNTVGHISLSFLPQDRDKLTNECMTKLAQEYMKKMGIVETPYVLVRHHDSRHPHCHILYSRVNNHGKVISDKNDRYRSTEISRAMEERHGLSYSEEKKNVRREKLKGADAIKYEIYDALRECLPKCKDWEDLILRLSEHDVGLFFKYRSGTDIKEGVIFEKDEQTFSGSRIDRKYSFANIEKQFDKNQNQEQTQKEVENREPTQKQRIYPQQEQGQILENTVETALGIFSSLGDITFTGGGDISYRPNERVTDEETEENKKKKKRKKRSMYHH